MREKIDVKRLVNNRICPVNTVHLKEENPERKHRYDVASENVRMARDNIDQGKGISIAKITELVIEFIKAYEKEYNVKIYKGYEFLNTENIDLHKLNESISSRYEGIASNEDIIWMKFAKEKYLDSPYRYLGVVACSNDINFQIPQDESEYDIPERIVNGKIKTWVYNTAGILTHYTGLEWDKNFVLIFPLKSINKKQRHEIENGIGNYLIENGVPIIDYYSHRI